MKNLIDLFSNSLANRTRRGSTDTRSLLLGLGLAACMAAAAKDNDASQFDQKPHKGNSNDNNGVVKSLNGLSGKVTLSAGSNITITPLGNGLRISAAGGQSAGVQDLNGATGSITLVAGDNVTITTQGNQITISSAGAGGTSGPDTNAWHRSGDMLAPGDFLGSLNSGPLEFKVNNQRTLRLELTGFAPNLIGGFSGNFVADGTVGATIGGGGGPVTFERNGTPLNGSNVVSATFGTVAGGAGNSVGQGCGQAVIGGGGGNVISSNSPDTTIAGGFVNLIEPDNFQSTIGGGVANAIEPKANDSTIGGGGENAIQAYAYESTIGGGAFNTIATNAQDSTIGGGSSNTIQSNALYSTIAGGYFNSIAADTSTVGGGNLNLIRAGASLSTIAGGTQNTVGDGSSASAIGGGIGNSISNNSTFAVIGGGVFNAIGHDNSSSVIGGGSENRILDGAQESVIAGGSANEISYGSGVATVAGGTGNTIGTNSYESAIGGGSQNSVGDNAPFATIPGGELNVVGQAYSFAAGHRAKAVHTGSFVWGDAVDSDVTTSGANQFIARASGGVAFYTGAGLATGVQLPSGGGSWSSVSDRNLKENLEPVDPRDILHRVAALPIQTWNLKTQDPAIRHIGPMAQDFGAAFSVGEDDKHISTVDADGVALAAIQGLNAEVEEKDARIKALEKDVAELKALVNQLAKPALQSP